MNVLLTAIALATVAADAVQEPPMPQPPAELKALSWMMGDFDADLQMFDPAMPDPMPSTGTVSSKMTMGDMNLESRYEADMGGMKMTGLQLTSYDSAKGEYVAYWFDSIAPGVLEMRGSLNGQVLVLVSKPIEVPGKPGKHAFRATSGMKAADRYLFRLEMDSGEGWYKMMEGMMTRK